MQNGIRIITAVSEALRFRKQKHITSQKEIFEHIDYFVRNESNRNIKLGIIAGTAQALDFLDKHPELGDRAAIQHVMSNLQEILSNTLEKE